MTTTLWAELAPTVFSGAVGGCHGMAHRKGLYPWRGSWSPAPHRVHQHGGQAGYRAAQQAVSEQPIFSWYVRSDGSGRGDTRQGALVRLSRVVRGTVDPTGTAGASAIDQPGHVREGFGDPAIRRE